MASTSVVKQESFYDYDSAAVHNDSSAPTSLSKQQRDSTSSLDSDLLSPFLPRIDSDSVSPPGNQADTPAASTTSLGHYQPSDFSDLDEDPFFGANFNDLEGAPPSFLDDSINWQQTDWQQPDLPLINGNYPVSTVTSTGAQRNVSAIKPYPLTPDQTASTQTTSPRSDQRTAYPSLAATTLPDSISPQQLQKPFTPPAAQAPEASQLTPSQSSSCRSSVDELAPAPIVMPCQSPRVTVSFWGKGDSGPVQAVERTLEDSPITVRGGVHSAGDLISSGHGTEPTSVPRDSMGIWHRDPVTGHGGVAPKNRTSEEGPSINEMATSRDADDRKQDVGKWLADNPDDLSTLEEKSAEEIRAIEEGRYESTDDIPLGHQTENKYVDGQTYYHGNGGQITAEDEYILLADRNFANVPVLHGIRAGTPGMTQPVSSQDAIEKFERMCRDNESILSRAATWGTRRRSHPSVLDLDMEEGVTSGSFLKKLSISRGGEKSRQGSLLKDIRGLVRRPSASGMNQLRKRSRSGQGEALYDERDAPKPKPEKRDSVPHLSPPSRTSSWGKKPMPSINTALVSMSHSIASVGTAHSRSGSISGPVPQTSPKSTLLNVKNTLRRPRSKSDLPKSTVAANTMNNDSSPGLVDMWKKSGGPPVASLNQKSLATATATAIAQGLAAEPEDEDDDDDEFDDDVEMKKNANIIDEINPNFSGFQHHVLTLNPSLGESHGYLVDRIAHQQVVRYKHLLTAKVKHLKLGTHCSCGSLCTALGGAVNIFEQKSDTKGLDSLSAHFADDDDDVTPIDGIINQESFPPDIPMPPTQSLPAEFECRLCFQRKKFQKPSDWTKHVHEDVQPFTCTWDKCRDPKIFKRKADWVRHENEGHRHLEWWTCDVEDCRHTCYRRDNFLQHLVREHKFQEPKVKTKAALKRSGGIDPTWQKVEQCHVETPGRPQDEPCRFCGKEFPTWKKLTVHLAKHMEQISLPVIRLVMAKAKELDADTIISPVQDPPPRPMIPPPSTQNAPPVQYPPNGQQQHAPPGTHQLHYQNQSHFMYPVMPQGQYQQTQFFTPQYDNIDQTLRHPSVSIGPLNQGGYVANQHLQDLPATTGSYAQGGNAYMAMTDSSVEPFPEFNGSHFPNMTGASMGYDGMIDPSNSNGSPFSGQESVSAYSHSPHIGPPTNGNKGWDERGMSGYM